MRWFWVLWSWALADQPFSCRLVPLPGLDRTASHQCGSSWRWHRSLAHLPHPAGPGWLYNSPFIRGYSGPRTVDALVTPPVLLPPGSRLELSVAWAVEAVPAGRRLTVAQSDVLSTSRCFTDGYDAAAVWARRVGPAGEGPWGLLTSQELPYNCNSSHAFSVAAGRCGWAGWTGRSDGWRDGRFELSEYSGEMVQVAVVFAADDSVDSRTDLSMFGVAVRRLALVHGDSVLLDAVGEPGPLERLLGRSELMGLGRKACVGRGELGGAFMVQCASAAHKITAPSEQLCSAERDEDKSLIPLSLRFNRGLERLCPVLPSVGMRLGQCPSGSRLELGGQGRWVQVAGKGADQAGCGIDPCSERYQFGTISQCAEWCESERRCRAFSWAPRDGDQHWPGKTVCTRYDNTVWEPGLWPGVDGSYSQIMCSMELDLRSFSRAPAGDETCAFLAQTGGGSCNEWCGQRGTSCAAGMDNTAGVPHSPCALDYSHAQLHAAGCDEQWNDQVCLCSWPSASKSKLANSIFRPTDPFELAVQLSLMQLTDAGLRSELLLGGPRPLSKAQILGQQEIMLRDWPLPQGLSGLGTVRAELVLLGNWTRTGCRLAHSDYADTTISYCSWEDGPVLDREEAIVNPPEANRTYSSSMCDYSYMCDYSSREEFCECTRQDCSSDELCKSTLDSGGAWFTRFDSVRAGQWLQMDLGTTMNVSGVVTQGRNEKYYTEAIKEPDGGYNQWVTLFTVAISHDGRTWSPVDAGRSFTGNYDSSTKVTHSFSRAVQARYVKLIVQSWHKWISMRAGVKVGLGGRRLADFAEGSLLVSLEAGK